MVCWQLSFYSLILVKCYIVSHHQVSKKCSNQTTSQGLITPIELLTNHRHALCTEGSSLPLKGDFDSAQFTWVCIAVVAQWWNTDGISHYEKQNIKNKYQMFVPEVALRLNLVVKLSSVEDINIWYLTIGKPICQSDRNVQGSWKVQAEEIEFARPKLLAIDREGRSRS